jgi:hypothetical protein
MRKIIVLLLALVAPVALAQRSPSCDSAPASAQVVVPPELARWISIECGEGGHVVKPAPGYFWRANTNGQQLKFPAVGPEGVPEKPLKGEAFFAKSRIFPITDDFLIGTNDAVAKQKGYAGPYRKGYLYDLLSNQGFEYRLFVMLVDNEPHMIDVVYQTTDKYRRVTLLVTRQ